MNALDNAVVKMHIDSLITIRYLQIDCLGWLSNPASLLATARFPRESLRGPEHVRVCIDAPTPEVSEGHRGAPGGGTAPPAHSSLP